jgi:hypothetical protein
MLIDELLEDPASFFENGKSNILLQEYFKGLPVESLIPLLESKDKFVQKTAIWIVSELSNQGCALLQYVVPLVKSDELYIRYYALESISICAKGENANEFIHLIKSINDMDHQIRVPAMLLLSNAEKSQLSSGIELVETHNIDNYKLHQKGLMGLLNEDINVAEIKNMLDSNEPLIQRYGVILSKNLNNDNFQTIKYALSSNNSDVKEFAKLVLESA